MICTEDRNNSQWKELKCVTSHHAMGIPFIWNSDPVFTIHFGLKMHYGENMDLTLQVVFVSKKCDILKTALFIFLY